MQVPTASGTVGLTIPAITIGALTLSAAQTTALAAGILLAKAAVVLPAKAGLAGLVGGLVGGGLGRRGRRAPVTSRGNRWRGNMRRGKRSIEDEEVPTIETFATLEVEDCYKRVICAAITGKVENPQVQNVLALFNPVQYMRAPLSHKAMKFVEAARYGGSRRSVAKCEHRYTCSLGMDVLKDLF